MKPILIVMGSSSDREAMTSCEKYLKHLQIGYDIQISSAHRQPEETAELARTAREKGYQVIIAAAGMAAHLPGVIAAQTTLPVIGVPLQTSALNGLDALYSIVQMPPGVPVATVAIGEPGAKNAAVLAAEILSLQDKGIYQKLITFKKKGSKI